MIKSYLINLNKDDERLSFFTSNFKRLGMEFERISAVDGREFSEQDFRAFLEDRPRSNKKTWVRGQMGCFLSHHIAWTKIAQSNERFSAVFEDDVHVSEDLKSLLSDDNWIPNEIDIIRLETSTNRVRLTLQPLLIHAKRKIYGVKSTTWCTGGYILNRRAAQQLIELKPQHHQPSDVILFNFEDSIIAKKLNILQCYPALCTQDKHLATGNLEFSSNLELPEPVAPHLTTKLKQVNPTTILSGLYKSLQGYKRITFR
ncbi:MAG: glycosyltransferase family 25 protein [Pseudomonadota bacterium]